MSINKSPLRYPGGKQKLTPFIIEILQENNLLGCHYIEPYAGGAGAALELLLTKKVSHIHLNDSSYPIYCFWKSLLNNTEEFCKLVISASLTMDEWRRQKQILQNVDKHSELEIGFSTFYLNRCNRSGVISGGVIGGNDQTGNYKMDARFKKSDLINKIEAIAYYKDYITLSNKDAEDYIVNNLPSTPVNSLVYLDPPYYEKSSGLYLDRYKKGDHERLSKTIQKQVERPWILSYDGADKILSYYENRRHFLYDLQYNAAKVYKGSEVFIFDDNIELPITSKLSFIDSELYRFHAAYTE
jgi:DNA adenine methylase